MANLGVDFYESGIGDTIVITFPSGGIGIVDAHPSSCHSRADIRDIISGKKIHFVCLTHPHTDHAEDLVAVINSPESIEEFWSPVPDVQMFTSTLLKFQNFPSPLSDRVKAINEARAKVFVSLFSGVAQRSQRAGEVPFEAGPFSSDHKLRTIDGVEIHCLSPSQSMLNQERNAYMQRSSGTKQRMPNPNPLSIVLALKYGGMTVLLGADALKEQWTAASKTFDERRLPKAVLLKVPHHGAANSFNFSKGKNYLDLCSTSPRTKAVLFAGDQDHPDKRVFEKLLEKADVCCLANGRKSDPTNNPLGLPVLGATAAAPAPLCNPHISFSLDGTGGFKQTKGVRICSDCFA